MPKLISRRSAPGIVLAAVLVAATIAAATAAARPTRTHASIKACALLPDTKSSTRYTLFDAPYLTKAFKAAGVPATVLNADLMRSAERYRGCYARARALEARPLGRGRRARSRGGRLRWLEEHRLQHRRLRLFELHEE